MSDQPTKRGGPLYWLKRRSRRFWIVATALPVLYVASWGPACWTTGWLELNDDWLFVVYAPFIWLMAGDCPVCPQFLHDCIGWYSMAAVPEGCGWIADGNTHIVFFGPYRLMP